MKQNLEPYRQKYATEMTFDEFLDWAVGHIVFGIGHGDSLRTNVHMILNQAIQNEVFGTKKKMPVEPTK